MVASVYVHGEDAETVQRLLDMACRSGELVPVLAVRPMPVREGKWEARAAEAGTEPPERGRVSALEYRLRPQTRRGHR